MRQVITENKNQSTDTSVRLYFKYIIGAFVPEMDTFLLFECKAIIQHILMQVERRSKCDIHLSALRLFPHSGEREKQRLLFLCSAVCHSAAPVCGLCRRPQGASTSTSVLHQDKPLRGEG